MIDLAGLRPARQHQERRPSPRPVPPRRRWNGWLLAGLAVFAPAQPRAVEIQWRVDTVPNAVEVVGLATEAVTALPRDAGDTAAWSRIFVVFAEGAKSVLPRDLTLPPVAGTWRVVDGRLRFEPAFPLVPGVRYRAEYRSPRGASIVSSFELPPAPHGAPTEVVQVFPSADVLPENQLKFYVQFSGPMSRGGTYERVRIRDASGSVIDLPFLELEEELWDPGMTRLTLLIDPGRIKRGVKPLEDIGPVFESGKRYSLTIDAACRDAMGHPLRAGFEKKFQIAPADRIPPEPRRWTVVPPAAGTRGVLRVEFDEPMDHALALRLIRVISKTPGGGVMRGEAELLQNERSWQFSPAEPWTRGKHALAVATTIEDLAGNNIGKTFDVDLAAGAPRRVAAESVSLAFEVK